MRVKRKIALLLAVIMLLGTGSLLKPAEVQAVGETNTFKLTVPANTNITTPGWNYIGEVKVTGSIEALRKVTVAITTDNNSNLKSGSNKIQYTIKKKGGEAISSIEFDATAVNRTDGASQAIGADVTNYIGKPAGDYEDTINFTATLGVTGVSLPKCTKCNCTKTFSVTNISELGKDTQFTHNDKTYYAYNSFIPSTSEDSLDSQKGSCWHQAQAFVAALNTAFPQEDGTQWMLFDSRDMAYDWWVTTDSAANKGAPSFGRVRYVWSSQSKNDSDAYCWLCDSAANAVDNGKSVSYTKMLSWNDFSKSNISTFCGFVVVRGPASN